MGWLGVSMAAALASAVAAYVMHGFWEAVFMYVSVGCGALCAALLVAGIFNGDDNE